MKQIQTARFFHKGILFHSSRTSAFVVKAFVSEDGEITAKLMNRISCTEEFPSLEDTLFYKILKIINFFIDCALLLFLWHLHVPYYCFFAAIAFCITISLDVLYLISSFIVLRFFSGSDAKFHAAEHMAMHAYASGKIPKNIEELSGYSMCHPLCGSSQRIPRIIFFLLACLNLILIFPDHLILYLILLFVDFLLVEWLAEKQVFMCFQRLYLSKPTNVELQTALKGLQLLEKLDLAIQNEDYVAIQNLLHL
mgnify:CR=1 FL=1